MANLANDDLTQVFCYCLSATSGTLATGNENDGSCQTVMQVFCCCMRRFASETDDRCQYVMQVSCDCLRPVEYFSYRENENGDTCQYVMKVFC